MFRTGFILTWRSDLVWFLGLPFLAIGAALASKQWLPSVALASVTLWITIPHHYATWVRAYGFADDWQRWKDRLVLGPLVIIGLTMLGLNRAPLTLALLVMLWDHQHSLMQQHGLARIYDFKSQTGAPSTRRFDLALNWVLFGNLVISAPLFTEMWIREIYRWGIPVTAAGVRAVQQFTWTATAVFGVAYLAHLAWSLGSGYRINPIKYLFLAVSYLLWYGLAWQTASFLVYAIGSKLMHGIQYIVIAYWYVRRRAQHGGQPRRLSAYITRPGHVKAFLVFALFYAALFQMITGGGFEDFGFGVMRFTVPYDSIPAFNLGGMTIDRGYDLFAASLIQAAAMIHYYFDSFIWKVREQSVQSGLA